METYDIKHKMINSEYESGAVSDYTNNKTSLF